MFLLLIIELEEYFYSELRRNIMQLIDFCGFQFNGVHSSDLNIVRVSNGSRYNEDLVPAFQDKTAQIEGGDGTLFWESFYSQRPFSIQIAFDSITEEGLRKLRQVFNGKDLGELIFDETPYKAYSVKVQSPPQLQYLCFDKPEGGRVYKGEGTISFIAYYPYAKSVHKFLSEYGETYTNKDEWKDSSKMKATQGTYDNVGDSGATVINLYNAGDIETDWQAFYTMTSTGCALRSIILTKSEQGGGQTTEGTMVFSEITRKNSNDAYIRINSRTNLIEGCDNNKNPTGSLYNEFLTAGDFFKIPLGEHTFTSDTPCVDIRYNYLYY